MVVARLHTHAGTWYEDDEETLMEQLDKYMGRARTTTDQYAGKKVKAIVSPHAGYRFSAPTAAHGYECLSKASNFDQIRTVFVLGPCHRIYLEESCALSRCHQCNTPLGALKVHHKIQTELMEKYPRLFVTLKDKKHEEDEHSLEMQFPFIAHVFKQRLDKIQIVPVMVGDLSKDTLETMGEALTPFMEDDECLFVTSSDFCHWGSRFSYQLVYNKQVSIDQSIRQLDMLGVEKITQQSKNPDEFYNYMKKYKNTICGKYPILILLHGLNKSEKWKDNHDMRFLHYSQSSAVKDMQDSSVSYVSIALMQ